MIFRKPIFLLCIPFSLIYFLIAAIRNIFYTINIFKRHRINAKVISVGNITWGGTGKTPVAAFIADLLARKGHNVSILIRGYGNDESELLPRLASNVPVLAGKDRVKKGLEAIEKNLSDTVLLDDGFQHRRLKRDLDIVCIDSVRPFGNGWLIPAGSLREGIGGLKRADIFLITKADLAASKDNLEKLGNKLRSINPRAVIAKAIHRPLYFYRLINEEKVTIGELQNRKLVLVSAIGSPECFEKTILRLGLKINRHFIFRDHHRYTKNDLTHVEDYCEKNKPVTIVTTEKDAVKLKKLSFDFARTGFLDSVFVARSRGRSKNIKSSNTIRIEYLVLKVRLEIIENEDGFYNRLFGIYSS